MKPDALSIHALNSTSDRARSASIAVLCRQCGRRPGQHARGEPPRGGAPRGQPKRSP